MKTEFESCFHINTCKVLGEHHNLPEPQFPQMQNNDIINTLQIAVNIKSGKMVDM
jgi:hypothetical protein